MAKKGYIYITSSGYDPEKGKNLKDPYLGPVPTLGACMPNIRRQVVPGDYIYVISGKVPGVQQLVIGGFEVAEKLDTMMTAFQRFPSLRLHRSDEGQLEGNIIITSKGHQHPLDTHNPSSFRNRIKDYVVGRDPVALTTPNEIAQGRAETMPILREVLGKPGLTPIQVLGRWSRLDERQVLEIRDWLYAVKSGQ
ncbi:MAG: hypothetical protein MN733_06465 [Nitrososphaera sp.]|nr:hypothetical protein [Nitrososphaera sp.]